MSRFISLPSMLYVSMTGLLLASPISPVKDAVLQITSQVQFMAPATALGAFAGISLGKDLKDFARLGWKMVIITLLVITGTFVFSALVADVVLRGSVGNKLLMNFLTRAYLAENGNIEAVYGGFAVDMDTGEITSLPLTNYYAATTVPVQVLDTHGPKLLVFAQIEQTVDPVKNMLSLRRRMGLIAPEDYLAGRAEYQMVQSLRDFV